MNIEDIKQILSNLDAGKVVKYDHAINLATQYMMDYKNVVEYLLQRLERYEKALEQFADETNWMGRSKREYPSSGIVEWDGEENPIKLAEEALKEE
jgi:DNA-binding transcriptional MerR regulator